jgi:hypothetical protein
LQFTGKYNLDSLLSYLSALANFETTISSASVRETNPDILGAVASVAFKEGFKEIAKQTLGAYAPIAQALLAMAEKIKQETDRAMAAQTSHSVGDWIKAMRTAANDDYSRHGRSEVLLRYMQDLYTSAEDDDTKQAIVDDASYATGAIDEETWSVAGVSVYERALYEGWINAHFSSIGRVDDDISGFIDIRFEEDETLKSASAVSPLGDRIGDALNNIADASGVATMMDLSLHKRVCRWAENAVGGYGWSCGWFDDRNELINDPNSETVTQFLHREDWRRTITLFR